MSGSLSDPEDTEIVLLTCRTQTPEVSGPPWEKKGRRVGFGDFELCAKAAECKSAFAAHSHPIVSKCRRCISVLSFKQNSCFGFKVVNFTSELMGCEQRPPPPRWFDPCRFVFVFCEEDPLCFQI